jgi:hypothetical protein
MLPEQCQVPQQATVAPVGDLFVAGEDQNARQFVQHNLLHMVPARLQSRLLAAAAAAVFCWHRHAPVLMQTTTPAVQAAYVEHRQLKLEVSEVAGAVRQPLPTGLAYG